MSALEPIVYVGDAMEAAGFALAGIAARTPAPGAEAAAFAEAQAGAQVVLLGAAVAVRLPRKALEAALAAGVPLVMILPDDSADPRLPDPVASARRQLGMEP